MAFAHYTNCHHARGKEENSEKDISAAFGKNLTTECKSSQTATLKAGKVVRLLNKSPMLWRCIPCLIKHHATKVYRCINS
jgi:hypothetical protein